MAGGGFIALGACYTCGRAFTFDPDTVPSYDPSLDDPTKPAGKQPICRTCIERINVERVAAGLPPVHIFPTSYPYEEG